MGGEEGDKFFNLEDLNADYGRKYRRMKQLNRNKENLVVEFGVADRCALSSSTAPVLTGSMANVHTLSTKTNRSPLFTPAIVSSGGQNKTPKSMLTESTSNIVRLVGKRRKLGDLPRSGHLNQTAVKCSSPVVTPRSNSRVNYMNPLEGSQDITLLSNVTNSGSASFSRNMLRGKENYLGFGRELFADEIVSDDEEESNDFNEGPNVVAPSFLSDDSEGSDYMKQGIVNQVNRCAPRRVVPEEYASLGGPTAICSKCHAQMWKEERVNKDVTKGCPIFSLCCMKGAVRLPLIPPTPEYLLDLYNDKKRDHSINNGRACYVYRLNGQNHHVFGSLITNDNETPKFCQLYIYDTINEVDNRLRWVSVHDRESVDKEVVRGLITMLDETNQLVGEFRPQRDLYESDEIVELQITLKVIRSESGRECHISSTDEVTGIMVGDTEETCGDRDIVVNEKGLTPRLGGRLFQQYMVDAFSTIEQTRLWWIRTHQTTLRNELYSNIYRSVSRGDVDSSNTGKGIVLPAGYVGSKRYMQQNFHDALAVCRYIGHPDIFLTMTSNSLWDEIQKMMEYVPGSIAPNCPDIISRVFRLKLDQLMLDIKDKKHFGVCIGVMYVVKFQKRGLSHNVDNFVSAEIPDPLLDPVGYAAVKEFMIHGPCGDKSCTFRANEALGKVAVREKNKFSKLEAFFYLNSVDVNARKYTYDEIPHFYVWNDGERKWTMRKRSFQIGRLCYVHHSTGEPWFLRLLLTKVRGATSFESLRTVNGVYYSTFRDACKEYGLLDDDKEWHEVLTQASTGGLPPQVRQLFVHIIVNCKVTDLKTLWSTHWKSMVDDILLRRRQSCPNTLFTLNDMQLQFYALGEIDELLRSVGKSLKKFDQLPQPPCNYLNNGTNNLIIEETSYDTKKMEYETVKLLQDCTEEQTLRSQGKIMLPVASSGIVATLMPGGRTAHSRFKIPIFLDECSTCNIAHDSDVAQLIKQHN
ncbi:uncharacterized protein LOC141721793 [Apium graveolens]|uniref:uncharacterized protein LOC141721793 n=1 Tax=Apium graveolens TaxID=4045 RepID=UPI003D798EAC